MPEGAIYVGRPTKWGNPYKISDALSRATAVGLYRRTLLTGGLQTTWRIGGAFTDPITAEIVRTELRGHDLVCWCPLDEPCHADVLLEIANLSDSSETNHSGRARTGVDSLPAPAVRHHPHGRAIIGDLRRGEREDVEVSLVCDIDLLSGDGGDTRPCERQHI